MLNESCREGKFVKSMKANASNKYQSILEEEVPIDRRLGRLPRATKHPPECLLLRVFWSALLHVPHTEGDAAIRDYDNAVFIIGIAIVGETNVLHNSIDESRRELGSSGILYSSFEVRRQPYGNIRHGCLDFEIEFETRKAPTNFELYWTSFCTNKHIHAMIYWLIARTMKWKDQIHVYGLLRDIDVAIPVGIGLVCNFAWTSKPQQGGLILFISRRGGRVNSVMICCQH